MIESAYQQKKKTATIVDSYEEPYIVHFDLMMQYSAFDSYDRTDVIRRKIRGE